MSMRLSLATSCFFLAALTATHAFAQDRDDLVQESEEALSISRQPQQRPSWETGVEVNWLARSKVRSSGGYLDMGEVKTDFSKRFSMNPKLELSAGFKYSLREIDAPASARLPDSLQTLALQFGAEFRKSDQLTLGINLAPKVSSDFEGFAARDIRVPVAVHARYQMSQRLSLLGGIAYTGEEHTFPVLPVLGVLYAPSEKWGFALGFPRTAIMYKPYKETELFLGATFSGGQYRLHGTNSGANVISYRDYRALAGVALPLCQVAKLTLSGGYAFGRKFVFYEGDRPDLNLDGAPFGSMELKIAW
jgi:hypothetical protein